MATNQEKGKENTVFVYSLYSTHDVEFYSLGKKNAIMAFVRQWVEWGPSWAANSLSKKPDSKRQIRAFFRMQVCIEMCTYMRI